MEEQDRGEGGRKGKERWEGVLVWILIWSNIIHWVKAEDKVNNTLVNPIHGISSFNHNVFV